MVGRNLLRFLRGENREKQSFSFRSQVQVLIGLFIQFEMVTAKKACQTSTFRCHFLFLFFHLIDHNYNVHWKGWQCLGELFFNSNVFRARYLFHVLLRLDLLLIRTPGKTKEVCQLGFAGLLQLHKFSSPFASLCLQQCLIELLKS